MCSTPAQSISETSALQPLLNTGCSDHGIACINIMHYRYLEIMALEGLQGALQMLSLMQDQETSLDARQFHSAC